MVGKSLDRRNELSQEPAVGGLLAEIVEPNPDALNNKQIMRNWAHVTKYRKDGGK